MPIIAQRPLAFSAASKRVSFPSFFSTLGYLANIFCLPYSVVTVIFSKRN